MSNSRFVFRSNAKKKRKAMKAAQNCIVVKTMRLILSFFLSLSRYNVMTLFRYDVISL